MTDNDTLIPQEIYVGIDGEEYRIYPMKLKDYPRVDRLFSKIDDMYLFLNLPTVREDKNGNTMLNEKGQPKLDFTAYNAMCELFEMALKSDRQKVREIVDVSNGVEILDKFRGISGLKKKIQEDVASKIAGLTTLLQA